MVRKERKCILEIGSTILVNGTRPLWKGTDCALTNRFEYQQQSNIKAAMELVKKQIRALGDQK